MKVVHVVEAWKGGIASYVQSLVKDQVARGYAVFLIADRNELDLDARDLGVEVISYNSSRNPLKLISVSSFIKEELSRISPDVVHCHSTFPGLYVRLVARGLKIVYTPHGWSFYKKDVGVVRRFFYGLVERVMSSRCHKITCMSLEEINSARKLGIDANKLSLIYTGIPDLPSQDWRGASDDELVRVGFFGRFDFQKGFDILEAAAPLLKNNVELHVFGGFVRGSERLIDSRMVNHGWVDHASINHHISSMDAVVIPSRWEGFALTPLEAMRAGKPVLVANKSSLPEVVIHGFNGLVLSDYSPEALAGALNSLTKVDCRRMGENSALVYKQTFKFDVFADKVSNLYV